MPLLSNKLLSIGLLLALVFALAALAGWFTAEANPQGILLHTPAADGTPPVYASAWRIGFIVSLTGMGLLAGVVVLLAQLAALLLKGSRHLALLSNLTLGAGAVVADPSRLGCIRYLGQPGHQGERRRDGPPQDGDSARAVDHDRERARRQAHRRAAYERPAARCRGVRGDQAPRRGTRRSPRSCRQSQSGRK